MKTQIPFWYIICNFLYFIEFLKIDLTNANATLKLSARLANSGSLKTRLIWVKGYETIIYVYEFTHKILSDSPNRFVDMFV